MIYVYSVRSWDANQIWKRLTWRDAYDDDWVALTSDGDSGVDLGDTCRIPCDARVDTGRALRDVGDDHATATVRTGRCCKHNDGSYHKSRDTGRRLHHTVGYDKCSGVDVFYISMQETTHLLYMPKSTWKCLYLDVHSTWEYLNLGVLYLGVLYLRVPITWKYSQLDNILYQVVPFICT